jgi:hypothetical protein|tara:strand:- start:353 stop:1357 length:1005 start_codon:yes stop_codon:yes gene_type:complete
MPEEKKMNTENTEIVDIDTSGPEVDVELKDEKEEKKEEQGDIVQPVETSEEKPEVQEEEVKQETETKEQEPQKDELKEYSEGVQRRIAKLTKKMREAERQRDEATRYAKSVLEKQKESESKLLKLQPDYLKSLEATIQSGRDAAMAKLAAAREAGDIQAEVAAQQELGKLGYQEAQLAQQKESLQKPTEDKKEVEPKETVNTYQGYELPKDAPVSDPKAEEWASKNKWFGTDNAMTYTAFDLHKKLTEEEGYDPKTDEYYSEIDKRIRLEFPHKFGSTEPTETAKPVQTVASAKRSTKTSRNTVRLTPSQVTIAKKLGVPLEEYAKQLRLTKEV